MPVVRLQGLVARQPVLGAGVERLLQPGGAVVGRADSAHLPGLDQFGVGRQGFRQGRVRVVAVRHVEVDVVGLQPAQRILDLLGDPGLREPLAAVRHLDADLGADHHPLAAAALLQPLADDGLALAPRVAGVPARIHIRRVDEIEACAGEGVEQPERGRFIGGPAEHVAAKGERRDRQARLAELPLFHALSPAVRRRSERVSRPRASPPPASDRIARDPLQIRQPCSGTRSAR